MQKYFALLFLSLSAFLSFAYESEPTDSLRLKKSDENSVLTRDYLKVRRFSTIDKELGIPSNSAVEITDITDYRALIREWETSYTSQDTVTNELLLQAAKVMEDLEASGNFVDQINTNELVVLPVGVKKEISNIVYTLGISKARFYSEYAEITAFVQIQIPQRGADGNLKKLFFGAENIKISHTGGIYGNANLVLLGNVPIVINGGKSMIILKGGMDMRTGNLEKKTYVAIDCNGFKELGLQADVEFSRDLIEPLDENFNPLIDTNAKVRASFSTIISDWNDLLVNISLPPFQLHSDQSTTGKAGLAFKVNRAIFDFSDLRNDPVMIFPNGYGQFLASGTTDLWRGIYIQELQVFLPPQFKLRNSERRIEIRATNLLIDSMGVSGSFEADNVLPISEGDASLWQFSVDHFEVSLLTNQLISAGFSGQIGLPISKEVTANMTKEAREKLLLGYSAFVDPVNDTYVLQAQIQEELEFDLFRARAKLLPNSFVELKVKEGRFRPKAVLNGSMEIASSLAADAQASDSAEKTAVKFQGIQFQQLTLETESPYLSASYLGYQGELSLANFPVTLYDIEFRSVAQTSSLSFGLKVNLMSAGFNGDTRLTFIGKMTIANGRQRWKLDRVELNDLMVEANIGFTLKGVVSLKDNDPTYGDGFYGELDADFSKVAVKASAWFGRTTFRYWYVDALVSLPVGLPFAPPAPLVINAFGGGAYYHMTRQVKPREYYANTPVQAAIPSGLNYKPDEKSGLGVRALIGLATSNSEEVFNGLAGFEMAFNKHGGINSVLFFGEAHLIKEIEIKGLDKFKDKMEKLETNLEGAMTNDKNIQKLKESNLLDFSKQTFPSQLSFEAGIDAYLAIEQDFANGVFHGTLETYVNTPGGLFQGVGPKGRAGWAVIHFGGGEWYIYVGTPSAPVGVRLGVAGIRVETTAYFMVGDRIPGSPPPPPQVADILGLELETLDYMRDLNALGEGRGLAFGAHFKVDTGDMTFLMFYARFQAGLGFDIMVKDYGDTSCVGENSPIGINGWYANGQAYAYLQGELGIRIKLLFVRKRIPIIKAGAAVLLQAKLPNPAWFRGYLGGKYNLLGGLVRGSFRFKVEIGKECEFVGGSPLDGLKIISDISPADNSTGVDVFTVPQVTFNMRINHPFELEDDKGVKTYRILLDEFKVTTGGAEIPGELQWNDNQDVANYLSTDILPSQASIKVLVKVSFQEKQGSIWVTLTQDGQVAREEEAVVFNTGDAPNYIPLSNIVYCYPVLDQEFFYPKEYPTGYVKLRRGQPDLFPPLTNWTQELIFESDFHYRSTDQINYNSGERLLSFTMPDLDTSTAYTLNLLSFPSGQDPSSIQNKEEYIAQETGQEGNTLEMRSIRAADLVREGTGTQVLAYDFQTSQYTSFAKKMEAKKLTKGDLEIIYSDVHALHADVVPTEHFDLVELLGNEYTQYEPLLRLEAILSDTYYTAHIFPLIYKGYPLESRFTLTRQTDVLGLPPVRAMDLLSWYPEYVAHDIFTETYLNPRTRMPYRYHLPYTYKSDFIDIQYKIINAYLKEPKVFSSQIQKYNYIINGIFPSIQKGTYKVRYYYRLPGENHESSKIFEYVNPY